MEFQQKLVIPSTWKTEVKEESSSSEEDEEEEDQEEDASSEEEEVNVEPHLFPHVSNKMILSPCLVSCVQEEVEPFPEERENFLQQLYKFMEDRSECSGVD